MIICPTYSFNKVSGTTAYDANDLVANHGTAGSVVPLSWGLRGVGCAGIIRGVRLYKASTTTSNASFKLYLFDDVPTPTNGDNGAFGVSSPIHFLDAVAFDMTSGAQAGTAGLIKRAGGLAIGFQVPTLSSKLYGLLQAVGTYGPATSELFKATLEIEAIR